MLEPGEIRQLTVVFGKFFMGIAALVVTLLAVRSKTLGSLPIRSFARLAWVSLVLTRVSVFVFLYLILGYAVPSDVPAAYYPEAKAALAGKLVYRDFFSTYAPLFPYICAIPVKFWDSTKSIVLFAIVVELVSLPVWVKVLASQFSDRTIRTALILYVFSPLLMSTVAIAGQNHVWISPFLAGGLYLLKKRRDLWAGVLLGLCVVSTKFMALIFVPVLWLLARRPKPFLVGVTVMSGAVLGAFRLSGADVLLPFRFQRSLGQESSGNVPYVLSLVGLPIGSPLYVATAAGLMTAGCLLLWIYRSRMSNNVLMRCGLPLLFVIVMLLSKKAYTGYWACVFVPLCLLWSEQYGSRLAAVLAFAGWGITATLEPTLYFRWVYGQNFSGVAAHRREVFLTCEVILLVFNLVVLRHAVAAIRTSILARRSIVFASHRRMSLHT
jgi:hypothetical protein